MDALNLPTITGDQVAIGATLLSPVLVVAFTAVLVLVLDLFPPDWASRRFLMWVAAFGLLVALGSEAWLVAVGWLQPAGEPAGMGTLAFGGFLSFDGFTVFFQTIFLLAALLVILSATTFTDRAPLIEGEFYAATLFSTVGLMMMAAGNELMTIYLGLELSSLSLAFLASWNKRDLIAQRGLKSTEAGVKFLLLSAMSTAILLYGMALLYGIAGVTTLPDIAVALSRGPSPVVLLSVTMLVAGFGFKIAAAPFQLWAPDVYQGAPTPATAFFSVASKSAGFAVILRVFLSALPAISSQWSVLFAVLSFITMTVGNLTALAQTNLKRLMAYSSITHVGYMLLGLASLRDVQGGGSSAIMYYLLAYAFTNLAAFIVIVVMANEAPDDEIVGYTGLARRSPGLAIALTVALLSLAGIPPFVGFFSKLYLFLAAVQTNDPLLQGLVIWAVIMSAVSLYYYGRVIHVMWMREPIGDVAIQTHTGFSQGLALTASVLGVTFLGLAAGPLLGWAQIAAGSLVR